MNTLKELLSQLTIWQLSFVVFAIMAGLILVCDSLWELWKLKNTPSKLAKSVDRMDQK